MTEFHDAIVVTTEGVVSRDILKSKKAGSRSDAYASYRFRAVVDWIELKIVINEPSNFDTVRKRIGVPYVIPLNKGAGGAATEFKFRFQDPSSWNYIRTSIARFTIDHPLAEPVVVTGIEIAVDAYSRFGSNEDLVEQAARSYKFATTTASKNRRWTKGSRHSTETICGFQWLIRRLAEGFNVYIGDRGDNVMQHIYVKQTNMEDGIIHVLPKSEHRARTEITLYGDALPYRLLDDWERHDFTEHSEFFQYRKLKEHLHPMARYAAEWIEQIGEKRIRQRKGRGTRLFSPSTVADTELNNLSYSALRELTKRMKR